MSERVRVSIVTPFLNAGRYIQQAIESVLAQTCNRWELLLVDDGSTDDSPSIALRYAARHQGRIRYLAHEGRRNEGASASRNLAIRHANGDYLAFLDADDVYLPRKLEDQIALLDANSEAMVLYAATEYWHSWSGRQEDAGRDWVWRKYGVDANVLIDPPRMLVTFLRDPGTVPCMGSMLVRREAVERVGGWEESFRYICTDQVFHAKLCLKLPVLIADACWDRYRQHEASSCHTVARAGQSAAAFEKYLNWLETYLTQEKVVDPAVWQALRKALRPYRHPLLHGVGRRVEHHKRQVKDVLTRVVRGVLPRSVRRRLRARIVRS